MHTFDVSRLPVALLRGAATGVAATLAMSVVMLGAQRLGIYHRQPPEEITDDTLDAADVKATEEELDVASSVAHLGFGAVAGALFEALMLLAPLRRAAPEAAGVALALGIWTVSYAGWVPALNIMPPPNRDEPGRPTAMIAAHVVFGAGLGLAHRFLRR